MATANLLDMSIIASDSNFGNRVMSSLIVYCSITIPSEVTSSTLSAPVHQSRKNYAAQVLNNPSFYKPLFVNAAASNQILANDATVGGTLVNLTSSGVSAAITSSLPTSSAVAGVTDTDINNAVAASFNAFISGI